MSGFSRAASRLTSGMLCWLTACSLMAGWTLDYPWNGEQFHTNDEVSGTGDAPAANLNYTFTIQKHGLGSIWGINSNTTEDVWWDSAIGPPNEEAWPVATANAVLYDANGYITHTTNQFIP